MRKTVDKLCCECANDENKGGPEGVPVIGPTFQGQAPISESSNNTTQAPQEQIPASHLRSLFDCVFTYYSFWVGFKTREYLNPWTFYAIYEKSSK